MAQPIDRHVEVLPDSSALIQRSLELLLSKIQAAVTERGKCTLALSGGSTPKHLYAAIAKENLAWDSLHVFWGDERYVSPNHPDSNQAMARQAWLNQVPIPPANIHPMPTDETDPAVAARKHEEHLQAFFHTQPGEFPQFDVILLGVGDDGHTASLFPHTDALQVRDRLVTVGQKEGQPRLTFTAPLINQARCVIFIAAGASKQTAIAQIFAPQADDWTYPARLIRPTGEQWWLLDAAAASELPQ